MKHWISGLLALLCAAALTGCAGTTQTESETSQTDSPVAGKKVAYIMQMAPSDIFQTWSQSAQETAEALGMEYDAFFCDGSDEQWQDTVAQCAAEGYDGLLLSHGGEAYAYPFLQDLLEEYPDLEIVTFDTQFKDSDGQTQTLEGVTQFFQQDAQLAQQLLEYVCQELYPEKAEAGEPIQILKV